MQGRELDALSPASALYPWCLREDEAAGACTADGAPEHHVSCAFARNLDRDVAGVLATLTRSTDKTADKPTLTDLFSSLPGYWPAAVDEALQRLDHEHCSLGQTASRLRREIRQPHADDPDFADPVRRQLPVPHPHDADWRFAPRTRALLLERASSHAARDVVLLGAPTLFAHACHELDLRRVTLLDRNPAVVQAANGLASGHTRLTARHADLIRREATAGLDGLTADVVIADPPWYRPEQRAFLRAAGQLLNPGGALMLAALPSGSRAAWRADRETLLEDAARCGFQLVSTEDGMLSYSSPPFERAALAAAGLAGVPSNWRIGDLLTFQSMSKGEHLKLSRGPVNWRDEVTVGRVRIRLRESERDAPAAGGAHDLLDSLSTTVPGGVSSSVSRDNPERQRAHLWTSGNGCWDATGPVTARAMLAALSRGPQDPENSFLAAIGQEAEDLRRLGWA